MVPITAKELPTEAKACGMPIFVMYYAAWCGKCAMMHPVIEDLEKEFAGKICFYEIEIQQEQELAEEFGEGIVPTFALMKDQTVVCVMRGMIKDQVLKERLEEFLRAYNL